MFGSKNVKQKNVPSQFLRAYGDIIKCLLSIDHQSSTKRYSIDLNVSQGKTANLLIWYFCLKFY